MHSCNTMYIRFLCSYVAQHATDFVRDDVALDETKPPHTASIDIIRLTWTYRCTNTCYLVMTQQTQHTRGVTWTLHGINTRQDWRNTHQDWKEAHHQMLFETAKAKYRISVQTISPQGLKLGTEPPCRGGAAAFGRHPHPFGRRLCAELCAWASTNA